MGIVGSNTSSPLEKPPSKLRVTGRSLSLEQEELINRLVYFQDEFEQPTDDDLKRLNVRVPILSFLIYK